MPNTLANLDLERFAVYASQAMLRGSDDDSVTLWLDGGYDQNPFSRGKADPEHPQHGTRYLVFAIEIDDNEMLIDQTIRDKLIEATKSAFVSVKEAKAVQKAAIMCKDWDFHAFVHQQVKNFTTEEKAAFILTGIPRWLTDMGLQGFKDPKHADEWCKYFLYYRCNITSRRQLSFKTKCREAFEVVVNEFITWGRKHK